MPEATPAKRYVATVEIIEVTETGESKGYNRDIPAKKDSRELAKFVVRDPDLEKLKDKLQKHVGLVD